MVLPSSSLAEQGGSGGDYFKDTYAYDANGNRTVKEERRGAGPTITNRSYTYDNSDKMTNYDGTTISYDNFGRPTQWVVDRPSPNGRGLVNLSFDYESRLKTMAIPGGSVYQTNTYNGLNTRVKVVETGYGSGTRKYVRDGVGVTSPVLRMTTGAENSPTWTNYTPGISERTSGTTKYSHSGIKNVDAQTNASQALTATREYDAFGNVVDVDPPGSFTGRFGYGGAFGYQEDDGGLKLLGHRFYDPVCGRFLTRDPIQHSSNFFIYCENDPLDWVDPEGLRPFRFPKNPSGLGKEWKKDPNHRNPNGGRYFNGKGDGLEFHKGQKGAFGHRGKDHWHILRKDHRGRWVASKEHYRPGSKGTLPRRPPSTKPGRTAFLPHIARFPWAAALIILFPSNSTTPRCYDMIHDEDCTPCSTCGRPDSEGR